ncbi:MAG: hypothetical protein JWR69_4299 [Pedosphaera sp.]|nr:hypothetical protein [Pedosphaera sp.]
MLFYHLESKRPRLNARRKLVSLSTAITLCLSHSLRARSENQTGYRYENYHEEGGRISVETHALMFGLQPLESLGLKGEVVYDSISGATPIGSPPPAGSDQVPLAKMTDTRRAGNLGLDWHWGRQTLSPQVAYSKESDYESIGLALNEAIEFNQKNTILRLGVAHDFDEVQPKFFTTPHHKDSTDFLLGVSQLLTPQTVLTADFTYGTSSGDLNDPYKNIRFDGWLPFTFIFPENRPRHRTKEIFLLSLTQFVKPANGSAEVSYRFYHDTFGINSHTAALTWHQKLGKRLLLEPAFRFYEQSAADFYHLSVPGLFPGDGDPTRPEFYSADYRLSHLVSFTYGVQATALITESFSVNVGYQRYEMYGLDNQTAHSAYPKANIFTIGLGLLF